MGNHPSNRIGQQDQSHKYRPDDRRKDQPSDGNDTCNGPTDLDLKPVPGLSCDRPPEQCTEGRKPDAGKLPQLFSLRIPLDRDHNLIQFKSFEIFRTSCAAGSGILLLQE